MAEQYGIDPVTGRIKIHPDFWKDHSPNARPTMGAQTPDRMKPLVERRISLPEWAEAQLPTGASRDVARMALHGLAQTGNTILKFLDIPNRVFGNTRSVLQDIYERSEANMARDAYEDRSGAPQVAETAVHLASAGVFGRALPAVFGANVGADTYETAKYAGESEGGALTKGALHGAVDTAIWTLGQGLASKYLPKAWQWLGRELTGAMRGAASSVTSDAMLNSMGADISGDEMAKRAVHAAWMVPLLGMLKIGGGKRREAMELLKKARPDLVGERAERVIEVLENEFSDRNSQVTALQWVARKGANLPDDLANIKGAIEAYGRAQDTVKAIPHMRSELGKLSSAPPEADPEREAKRQDRITRLTRNLESAEKLAEDFNEGPSLMKRSPFEIVSNENYARFLPRPDPKDVPAFSNMKRYPMGVMGFDVSDDAAGRQATREMINAYMSPSSNPWCLATGKGAAKLGELGPDSERYWKGHSAVPKQIFFQEVDGKLELTAFRATSSGGEGRQEYWDTSDAGYSGIPIKVKVPGDPMGRYRKMVFRPKGTTQVYRSETELERGAERGDFPAERLEQYRAIMLRNAENVGDFRLELRGEGVGDKGEVQGTFEDIAPGKVFKGDPFRDGRSQTWVLPRTSRIDGMILDELTRHGLPHTIEGLRELRRGWTQPDSSADSGMLDVLDDNIAKMGQSGEPSWVLAEDKVRTTENGITKFRTTKYVDPTDPDLGMYEGDENLKIGSPVVIEESELVSPEWMRSRGYDPESEADVRRMQQDLDIQAWGNGAEAAMAVVPTKRTFMRTKSGTPETVTYGPNGRDVVSVDFEKDGVPYREEYFHSGPSYADSSYVYHTIDFDETPHPSRDYLGINEPAGYRLTRNPGGANPEVLNEVQWDDGLGGFMRTSGNRRWYIPREETERIAREQNPYEAWMNDHASVAEGPPFETAPAKIVIEDRQPDGTWALVETRNIQASPSRANTLLPPPDEIPLWAQQGLTEEALREEMQYNEAMERQYNEEMGRVLPEAPTAPDPWDMEADDIPFALKAGRTRRNVRAAEGGGDTPGSEMEVSEPPVSGPAPQDQGGPRIVINPTTFKNKKDALCVAFNEGFRLWMEANDFQPQSEPTDRQRRFFSDTAYADDELQLRRTILARVATFDTSVKDPTDDQLTETAQFLDGVLESGWCKNEWEQDCVSRLSEAVKAAIGAEPVEPREEPLEPAQAEPLEPAGGEEVQALQSGGSTDGEEEDKFALQNAGKSFAVDYVEAQDLKRREAELEASLGMTPPEGQEQAQEPAAGQGAPTVQPGPPDAPQAGKPAESDEPTDEQVRQAEERNKRDLAEIQRETGRPKLTLASPVDSDSPGSIAYKGSRSGDIREPIVSSDSQGSIAFRGARKGGIENPTVESGSAGSIAFSGTRPGGIEDPAVGSGAKGSIAGAALDYAPGSIESPVDDPRRKEEQRKRRDRRRRGLL